ncbi:MAG: tRNA pseudouridine(55) synthase TruB, partial [Anaerovoracaceae bacterium]|nr:tRNA pseudouridine(55) synthase TruB [Anaerovoracaceae bacterium]
MQGIVNVFKPQNFTSHDCVAILRGVTGIKKIGHTGTLDPMATGVLPCCIGKATRIIEYLDNDLKEYECTMRMGMTSDTMDIWGNITYTEHVVIPDDDRIIRTLKSFEGNIEQIPPKYSAVRVNGRRLYEYARAGKDV